MILRRKLLAAIVSSILFATVFSTVGGLSGKAFFTVFYLNLTMMLLVAVGGSMLSDWLATKVVRARTAQEVLALLLHLAIGASFQLLGVASAMIFYIVDRLLKRFEFGWKVTGSALLLACIGFLFMSL